MGTRNCSCIGHDSLSKTGKTLFDLEEKARNRREEYMNTSVHTIKRLSVRNEFNTT